MGVSLIGLSGCGPKVANEVDRVEISDIDKDTLNEALKIKTYLPGINPPSYKTIIGPISAFSCKKLTTDPSATSGEALINLQLEALKMGASAIINLTFDKRGTDAWGTNCWETVQASAIAVR